MAQTHRSLRIIVLALQLLVLACAFFTTVTASAAAQSRTRKDVNALSPQELQDYIHALNILRARSMKNPSDTTGYAWWAALHNDLSVGPCEHGNDLFFAWHRAHLVYFEELLRAADPPRTANVTIPFWDFMQVGGPKFPIAFSTPGLTETDRSQAKAAPPADTLDIVRNVRDWSQFGGFPKNSPDGDFGDLEFGPHNDMHGRYIGGKMGNPETAAEDSIYWSFHAFLDLLWDEWQRRNSNPPPTSPEASLRGFSKQPKRLVKDFQSVSTLGYSYELNAALKKAFGIGLEMTTTGGPPPKDQRVVAALAAVPAPEQPSAGLQVMQYALPADVAGNRTSPVVLRFKDITLPTRDSLTLRVFVHPKAVPFANTEAFERQYFVGYKSFWKSPRAATESGHHPATAQVRVAVDRARLPGAPGDLVATLVVTRSSPPVGKEAAGPPERLNIVGAAVEYSR